MAEELSPLQMLAIKGAMFNLKLTEEKARWYVNLPLCEQRRFVEDRTGVPMRFVSCQPKLLTTEEINFRLDQAMNKALRKG